MSGLNDVKSTLLELGVTPRKSRGQNFLIDKGSIQKAVRFAEVQATEHVVEVGPGLGALTEHLIEDAASFHAIDIEPRFIEHLRSRYPSLSEKNWKVADVREVELGALGFRPSNPCVVVSNVPYSLSSEMILWILGQHSLISRASLLLQREFAERVAAGPGGKDYGSLSVLSALYADVRLGPKVTGSCFFPPADVESRFVEFRLLAKPRFAISKREAFEKLVRSAFSKRRKTLLNAISSSEGFGEKLEVERWIASAGIDPGRRGETLSLEEFVHLLKAFESQNPPR